MTITSPQSSATAHGASGVRGGRLPLLAIIAATAFLTVVDLFAAQALLPALTKSYGVSPRQMGLAVNSCTLGMAIGGLGVAFLGDRVPRRTGILASLIVLSLPTMLLAAAPSLFVFAALRVIQGLAMSAAFGLTLAYIAERFSGEFAASAFAAYITGNVASNLLGRLLATAVADHSGLGAAFLTFAGLNLAGACLAYATIERLPASRASADRQERPRAWLEHLANPRLRAGFGIGFCILFAFIGIFTYINFVLVSPPLSVGMMQLGFVYLVFLPAIVTTPLAGGVVSRIGGKASLYLGFGLAALGLPLLLVSTSLVAILAGMVLVSVGTFFAQAVATGLVSRGANSNRSSASGLYLSSYFLGGLAGTAAIGMLFEKLGWPASVAGVGVALGVAACLSRRLG